MDWLFKSQGVLRTLGCILATAGEAVKLVPLPQVSVWGDLVSQIGIALGGAGCLRAAASGTLFSLQAK